MSILATIRPAEAQTQLTIQVRAAKHSKKHYIVHNLDTLVSLLELHLLNREVICIDENGREHKVIIKKVTHSGNKVYLDIESPEKVKCKYIVLTS